jgi:hypothetical protein
MTQRLEAHTLDLTVELAPHFRDTARLLMLSDQAWHWAAEQTALSNAPAGALGGTA